MRRLLNYIIILSLSLFVFGCDSILSSGTTIDKDSDEFDYIETTEKGIVHYKGTPFNGSITESLENGQLGQKTTYKDGKKEVFERYYENGQLEEKGTYKDGVGDGAIEMYYEEGKLKAKGTLKDGKKDGVFEWYYENGQLEEKGTYKDGKIDGAFESYNEDGTRRD